jgi:acetyl-CoA carboxylase biotin carboxyl carrier protein
VTATAAQTLAAAPAVGPAPKPTADEVDVSTHATIASPMVGTFYRRPAPDKPPYIEEGDLISPNQPVCIIEAMKLMNEIKSDIGGRVVKVMAQNEQPVQEGQVLFLIEPM